MLPLSQMGLIPGSHPLFVQTCDSSFSPFNTNPGLHLYLITVPGSQTWEVSMSPSLGRRLCPPFSIGPRSLQPVRTRKFNIQPYNVLYIKCCPYLILWRCIKFSGSNYLGRCLNPTSRVPVWWILRREKKILSFPVTRPTHGQTPDPKNFPTLWGKTSHMLNFSYFLW